MEDIIKFIAPKNLSSYIKVIGVGNCGINAVNNLHGQGIEGVDLIVCDTDSKSLANSQAETKILIGEGLGTGGNPVLAKQLATEAAEAIKAAFTEKTTILFIMAGMGGGTGTGAVPVITKIVRDINAEDKHFPEMLVVAVVTMPFHFEGKERMALAQRGLDELRSVADAVMVIDNNKVLDGEEKVPFSQFFYKVDELMSSPVKNLSAALTCLPLINCDFRDIVCLLRNGGDTFMGVGVAKGETRAIDAMLQALQNPLTVVSDMSGARAVFLHLSTSKEQDMIMDELAQVERYFNGVCVKQPRMMLSIGQDDTLGENIRVIVVATDIQPTETGSDDRLLGDPRPIL